MQYAQIIFTWNPYTSDVSTSVIGIPIGLSLNDAANQICHFHCLQTSLAGIATFFLIALSPLRHKTEPLLTATQYLVQKPPPLAPPLCCHCPLIVILLLRQPSLLQQNCSNATSWLLPFSKKIPDAIACCMATATAMLLHWPCICACKCRCCCCLFAVVAG